jgi:hypothetical protein
MLASALRRSVINCMVVSLCAYACLRQVRAGEGDGPAPPAPISVRRRLPVRARAPA